MISIMSEGKQYNIRLEPDLTDWVERNKVGNASIVIRAGVWLLMQQKDPMQIIQNYQIRDMAEGLRQAARSTKTKRTKSA